MLSPLPHKETAQPFPPPPFSFALANKLGLDLGKSAAKDIKYAQETVDAWLDGMTTAISNAQKRKAQAQQKQEAKQETATAQKAEQEAEQGTRNGTVQDLELALEATRKHAEFWKSEIGRDTKDGLTSLAELHEEIYAEAIQREKGVATMLAKARKGDVLSSEELATLDSFYDEQLNYKYLAKDWKAFREQGQKAETKNEQSNNRMFMLNDSFVTELNEWYKGDRNIRKRFYIGTTSDVLSAIAGRVEKIYWDSQKINDIKKKHPKMTLPVIEQVPNIIEDPVMILDSRTVDGRIVMFGDVYDKSGSPVMVAVELSASRGSIDDFAVIASAYARGEKITNTQGRTETLQEFINDSNVRYVTPDKKRLQSWLKRTRLQLPIGVNSGFIDGIVSDSSENGNRKMSLNDSTGRELSEGQQEYFKDSVIRDEQGRLKVMYRGARENFTVFDRKKASHSNLYGRGFYFTDSESHARQYGDARSYYLKVTNPVSTKQTTITRAQLRKFIEAVAQNEDYGLDNYGYGSTVDSVLKNVYGSRSDFAMLYDIDTVCVGDMVATVELFNEVNGTNYDGFILPTETVVFSSEQIKEIDNLNPTSNPDIRFSLNDSFRTDQAIRKVLEKAVEEIIGASRAGGAGFVRERLRLSLTNPCAKGRAVPSPLRKKTAQPFPPPLGWMG